MASLVKRLCLHSGRAATLNRYLTYTAIKRGPKNDKLMEMINANPHKPWDWYWISQNPNLTLKTINANPDKPWDWYWISQSPNITMEMINANPDKPWEWCGISRNPNLTMEMIKANPDKPWQWYWLSRTNINVTKEINSWLDKLR